MTDDTPDTEDLVAFLDAHGHEPATYAAIHEAFVVWFDALQEQRAQIKALQARVFELEAQRAADHAQR